MSHSKIGLKSLFLIYCMHFVIFLQISQHIFVHYSYPVFSQKESSPFSLLEPKKRAVPASRQALLILYHPSRITAVSQLSRVIVPSLLISLSRASSAPVFDSRIFPVRDSSLSVQASFP